MLTDEQITIAVNFWSDLFNTCVAKDTDRNRFKKALTKVITEHREVIQNVALQVIPHYVLSAALKEAKAHKYTFPFKKLDTFFTDNKVLLYERDKFIKELV